jgi:hypothetical protein
MKQIGRTSRCLRSTTAVAAVMVAAAVLVAPNAQATMTFQFSSVTPNVPGGAPGSVQESVPSGAVGGVQSPAEAGSTLNLVIDASEAGAGLASAQATVDGSTASVSLCPQSLAGKCPEAVSGVPLSVGVGGEGTHELIVTVTDSAGNTGTLAQRTIDVLAPVSPGSNTVTVGVSAGRGGPPVEAPPEELLPEEGSHKYPHEEPPPKGPPVCPSPMLEMHLASKPLRYTREHVPVLRPGRLDLFTGRLTCLHRRRRVSAPDGTPVRVLYKDPSCALGRPGCMSSWRERTATVHKGRLGIRLRIVSPGAIVFSYRPRDGESVEVSLPVAVADGHHSRTRHHSRTPNHRGAHSHSRTPNHSGTHNHRGANNHSHAHHPGGKRHGGTRRRHRSRKHR